MKRTAGTLILPFLVLAGAACFMNPAKSQGEAVEPGTLRIALLSDTHTTRSTKDDRPTFKPHLDAVIRAVNAAHPDVVLVAGDLTEGGLAEQFSDYKNQISGIEAPLFSVPGNHDVGDKILPDKPGGVNEARLNAYEKAVGPLYFVSNQPKVRIIGINSSLLGSGLPQEARQWEFLEKTLAEPMAVPTVLLMHYRPFLKTADEEGGGYWNVEPAPRRRLLDLIRKYHVRAVLSGHLHRELFDEQDGIAYITTTAVSWGIPKDKQTPGWTLVTIDAQGAVKPETQPIAP